MDLLDDFSNDHHSVGSACSFQVQLMRCGFLPQNSVSSFDLRDHDLEELEIKEGEDADNQNEDQQDSSDDSEQSSSPKPCPRRGLIKTLSFRLSARNLLMGSDSSSSSNNNDEGAGAGIDDFQYRRDSMCSQRNQGLKKRVERERRLDRSPRRAVRRTKSDGCVKFVPPSA